MPFLLVTNPSSADDLPGRAIHDLDDARVLTLDGSIDLRAEITSAIAEGRIVVACGGDGTVNAVVQHLAGTEGVLGVLPGAR